MKSVIPIFLLIVFWFAVLTVYGQAESMQIDKFQEANCEDLRARLDNFAIQLNHSPHATGTVAISGKINDLRNSLYYEAMIEGYFRKRNMLSRLKIFRTRVETERHISFWLTPADAQPPPITTSEWSLDYPEDSKAFIFTHGDNYAVEISVCLYVDELAMLAKVVKANPKSRTHVVLKVRSEKEFARRKRQTITDLTSGYTISRSQIRIFKQSGFKGDRYGIEPNTEYWFVP